VIPEKYNGVDKNNNILEKVRYVYIQK